jgi:hypothetical protein
MSNSIGDLRNSGNQSNNWPWQYKVLKGLQDIIDSNNNCCTELNDLLSPKARTPRVVRATGSFTNAVKVFSFSVANVGTADGIVLGVTIKPGEIVNYDASALNNFFAVGAVTANGTGTELLITYIS